jgi:hypothetical protein
MSSRHTSDPNDVHDTDSALSDEALDTVVGGCEAPVHTAPAEPYGNAVKGTSNRCYRISGDSPSLDIL